MPENELVDASIEVSHEAGKRLPSQIPCFRLHIVTQQRGAFLPSLRRLCAQSKILSQQDPT